MTGAVVRIKQSDISFNTMTNLCVELTVLYVP